MAGLNHKESQTLHLAQSLSLVSPLWVVGALVAATTLIILMYATSNRWGPGDTTHVTSTRTPGISPSPTAWKTESAELGFRHFVPHADCTTTSVSLPAQNRLWLNDGSWWGSLCHHARSEHHIYRLDSQTQSWIDTGVVLDDRAQSRPDVLWDNVQQKLYVVSSFIEEDATSALDTAETRLYRFSYDLQTKQYDLDSGFPVEVTDANPRSISIARDTQGRLWVTYVERGMVMVAHTTDGGDSKWGRPFMLPVPDAGNLSLDDVSAIVAFHSRVGIMWNNKSTGAFYFAVHRDEAPQREWRSTAVHNLASENQISLKSVSGSVFAAVTTLRPHQVVLLVCKTGDCTASLDWDHHTIFGPQPGRPGFPVLFVEPARDALQVFVTLPMNGGRIHYKRSYLSNIKFPAGPGWPFMQDGRGVYIGGTTSTRQYLPAGVKPVVMASDLKSRHYLHNELSDPANDPTAVPTATETPANTPIFTQISPTLTLTLERNSTPTRVPTDPVPATATTNVSATATSASRITGTPVPSVTSDPSITPIATVEPSVTMDERGEPTPQMSVTAHINTATASVTVRNVTTIIADEPTSTGTTTVEPVVTATLHPTRSATPTDLPDNNIMPTPTLVVAGNRFQIVGAVILQGRTNYNDVKIFLNDKPMAVTDQQGRFAMANLSPGFYQVRANLPGYLISEEHFLGCHAGRIINMRETILLGGDTTQDGQVNLFDLVLIGRPFNTCGGSTRFDARADLNQTGCVDIFDFVLASSNYGRLGPTRWTTQVDILQVRH